MARGPKARRYAQAAFQIARERGQIEDWLKHLQEANERLQDSALAGYLALPKVPLEQKLEMLANAVPDVNPLVRNLLALLIARYSLEMLPAILKEYQRLLDVYQGKERGMIITAVPVEEEQIQRLAKLLAEIAGMEVVLTRRVEPEIVGGVVARIGDRVIDGSTRARLEGLKSKLMQEAAA